MESTTSAGTPVRTRRLAPEQISTYRERGYL